ncbi:hypothetical protein QF000_005495 [Paraburkholderia atlantica]|uniref:hypothetical protein n=1 Tax=Paraburkholderia atlantica TaxID=2654982 RepID=UPI003D1DC34D
MPKVFDRTETTNGWLYHDPNEQSFVLALMIRGVPIIQFDNLLEETESADARLHRLAWRTKAQAARTTRNADALEAWITLITVWTRMCLRDEFATPLARSAKKHNEAQKAKAKLPRGIVAEIIRDLAGKTDELGVQPPAKELWQDFLSRLDAAGFYPRESDESCDDPEIIYEKKDLTEGSIRFSSFRSSLSRERRLISVARLR